MRGGLLFQAVTTGDFPRREMDVWVSEESIEDAWPVKTPQIVQAQDGCRRVWRGAFGKGQPWTSPGAYPTVFYGKTRKEVADKLKVALREQQQGKLIAAPQQTVAEYFEYWLKVHKKTIRIENSH